MIGSLFVPGRNCWQVTRAHRAAVLIDSCTYYLQLRRMLAEARHTVFIIGWDFDSACRLDPRGLIAPAEETVGDLLERLVAERPDLEIFILIWNMAPLIGSSDLPTLVWGTRLSHPRIHVKLDSHHPMLASHHQKLVCVDDAIAFCGGIDISSGRWDEPTHLAVHPLRLETNGEPYGPVHDMQMVVDGPVAQSLAGMARQRWLRATGGTPPALSARSGLWPEGLTPFLRDIDIAIARTDPSGESSPVREAETLNIDAIEAARQMIYIESQYFSATYIVDLLCGHLADPSGPEVIVVATRESHGWIEDVVMSRNRDRHLARLKHADKYGRFRAFFALSPGDAPREIVIHSKVVIIDDRFLRVGSSNMNNRSRGLDTECDLAIEATTDEIARSIVSLRDRLISEHLGLEPDIFAAECRRLGSVVAAVDSLNGGPRRLCPFEVEADGSLEPLPGTALLDPDEPISLDYLWRIVAG